MSGQPSLAITPRQSAHCIASLRLDASQTGFPPVFIAPPARPHAGQEAAETDQAPSPKGSGSINLHSRHRRAPPFSSIRFL